MLETALASGPIASVQVGDRWGFIDPSGRYVIDLQFEGAGTFSYGLASVKVVGRWGYIDETGKLVITPQFDSAGEFSEGLANGDNC